MVVIMCFVGVEKNNSPEHIVDGHHVFNTKMNFLITKQKLY